VSKNTNNRKKFRKQKHRQNLPWPVLAIGGLLLLAAAFLFASRGAADDGSGTAHISVDQPSIEYGYVKFGEDRQFKVKVTNTGDGLLRFKEKPYIEVLEGC
jgi:hypothetical protein